MFVQGTCVVTHRQCVWPPGFVRGEARKQQDDSQSSDDLSCFYRNLLCSWTQLMTVNTYNINIYA